MNVILVTGQSGAGKTKRGPIRRRAPGLRQTAGNKIFLLREKKLAMRPVSLYNKRGNSPIRKEYDYMENKERRVGTVSRGIRCPRDGGRDR